MIRQSFTLRVLVISFLLLALPLLIDSFIFFKTTYDDSIKDAKHKLKEIANFRIFSLTEIHPVKQILFRELDYLLNLSDRLKNGEQAGLNEKLSEIADVAGNLNIFVLDMGKEGKYKILASSDEKRVGTYFSGYAQLNEAIEEGEGSFSRYIYSEKSDAYDPTIFLVRVIKTKEGKPVGILMVSADAKEALEASLETIEEARDISIAVLDKDGIAFIATHPEMEGEYFDPLSLQQRQRIRESDLLGEIQLASQPLNIIKGEDPPYFEFVFKGAVQIAYRAYAPNNVFSVVVYAPKEVFFGKAVRHFLFLYIVYAIVLVVGGGITYWLALWISRPLRQLTHLMGEVGEGNLNVRFKEEPLGFEINILGGIFNNTVDNLLENIQRAEDERVKKEAYQRELSIGREVQQSLLPSKIPTIQGAELAATYLPAKDVGGDFYSYLSKKTKDGEDVFVLTVADAASRGIYSCLYALSARSLFRTYATLYDDVGEILSHTNNAFLADTGETGMFVTAFSYLYHTSSKSLSYYSCGHVPGIVRRADGHLETLVHAGMALGLVESTPYTSASIQLNSGDVVLLFTDGLLEAVNDKNQHFSQRRLNNSLQTRGWKSAQEVIEGVTEDLRKFTGSVPQEEEVILVALRVN